MKPEYGRSSLVRQLKTIIGPTAPDVSLYRLLARIEQPLVLISANYDLFLEHQLQQAGRKYALIASIIISNPPDCELGNVIVHYSDREAPEFLRLEEELSSLKLIEDGYALIYKIRGYCNAVHEPMAYQHNILTLAEENYFTFARHMDRLIPNYLVKQFPRAGCFSWAIRPATGKIACWSTGFWINAVISNTNRPMRSPRIPIPSCALTGIRGECIATGLN